MTKKKTIENRITNIDNTEILKRMTLAGLIGGGIGIVVGFPTGRYLGEFINNNVELFRNTPREIQNYVNIASILIGVGVSGTIGASIAQIPRIYKIFKKRYDKD